MPQTAQTGKILEDFFLAPEKQFKTIVKTLIAKRHRNSRVCFTNYILSGVPIEISTHKNSPYLLFSILATHLDNITLLLYTIDKNLDSPGGVIKELIKIQLTSYLRGQWPLQKHMEGYAHVEQIHSRFVHQRQ